MFKDREKMRVEMTLEDFSKEDGRGLEAMKRIVEVRKAREEEKKREKTEAGERNRDLILNIKS